MELHTFRAFAGYGGYIMTCDTRIVTKKKKKKDVYYINISQLTKDSLNTKQRITRYPG